MAWAFQTGNGSSSHTITLSVTAGDLIVVWFGWGSGTLTDLTSISDTVNTYTLLTGAADSGNSQSGRGGWTVATTTTSLTITGNGISGFSYKNAVAGSWRESGTISFIGQNQQFASFTTATDNVSSGNVTPSAVGDLILGYSQNTTAGAGTLNAGTSYTIDAADAANPSRACALESRIAASTSAQSATFTQGAADGQVVAAMVFHATGAAFPTTTIVTGSATAAVGIAQTYTYTLDASPAGTVTVTPTAPVAGSWSPTTVGLTSGNWNTGLTSNFTASAAGSGNIASTNDGGLTNDTLAVTVYSVSRPSAVTPNTWTDEAGGSLVVVDINDASDSTGAKDPAGASYPVLAFTMDTPMAASVSQTCYFRGNDVTAGKQIRQVLFATDGTTVVATGAWHTMTGSLATYSDVLTPTATAYKGEIQTQAYAPIYGLDFPESDTIAANTVQMLFTGADKLPMVPATYIHRVKHRYQPSFYTVFFNGRGDGTFAGSADYYGCHPYPVSGDHKFEVSAYGGDHTTDLNANDTTVAYDAWYTQAVCVYDSGGRTYVDFYWDLPDTTKIIRFSSSGVLLAEDGAHTPTLTYGDAPWSPMNETLNGVLRGIQQYDYDMSAAGTTTTDLLLEAANDTSNTPVTANGIANVWYMNQNPTPTDVTDKSGNGHDPAWANANRPTLYTG